MGAERDKYNGLSSSIGNSPVGNSSDFTRHHRDRRPSGPCVVTVPWGRRLFWP